MRILKSIKLHYGIVLTLIILSTLFATNLIVVKAEDLEPNPYDTPGAEGIPLEETIKIGILNDMSHFSWDHTRKGAYLAAEEINEAGGILIDETQYYIGFVEEDTHETEIPVDPSQGVEAANKIINDYNPHFIIGGYTNNAVLEYIAPIMAADIPFLGTGCSADELCRRVVDPSYGYKYFFRVMPINGTSLFWEFVTYISYLANHLTATLGTEINKIALMYEDLPWVYPMLNGLKIVLPTYGLEIVSEIIFSISANEEDFAHFWSDIDGSGAQITIPLITQSNAVFMSQKYAEIQPKSLVCGINVPGHRDSYFFDSNGGCQYEITMQLYNTSKTPLTEPFWDKFVNKYGENPLYPGIGAYDAVHLLAEAVNNAEYFYDPDEIVTYLEGFDKNNYFVGVGGNIAFTSSHDLFEGYPYGYTTFCQWQEGGTKVVLSSGDNIYPDSIATGTLMLPEWGIIREESFVRYGTAEGPNTIDPHNAFDSASINVIDQVVESLFAYDLSEPNCRIVPRLASDFGAWSEDGLSYVVPLRQDVTFHDGFPFNATCVEWNFERLTSLLDPQSNLAKLFFWPDGSPIIVSVEAIDTYQVEFALSESYAPLEALLSSWATGILSPSSTPEDNYIDPFSGDLIGTGPFMYDAYDQGMSVRFSIFEDYWNGRAYINDLAFLIIPDSELRNQALLDGKIDFLTDPSIFMIETFESYPNLIVTSGHSSTIYYLGMNNLQIDIAMREAISYAIDYDQIIQNLMYGKAERLRSPLPQGILYAKEYNIPELDVQYARGIVKSQYPGLDLPEVDAPDSEWIAIANGDSPVEDYIYIYVWGSQTQIKMLDILEVNLSKIGVKVTGEGMDYHGEGGFWDRLNNHKNDQQLFFLGWGADYNDPSDYLNPHFADNGYTNFAQVHIDDEFQSLLQSALMELDPELREELYDQIQQRLVEEFPWCWCYTPINYDVNNYRFTGFQSNPLHKVWFYSVYPSWMDLTPPVVIYDTIPDEVKITYTRSPQIIGSIKAYDISDIIYVGWVPFQNPDPGFSLITTYNKIDMEPSDLAFSETVVMTTSLLECGTHFLKIQFYDLNGYVYDKTFTVIVYRKAELKLSGEFDYLEKEKVKISIAAQILDLEENFPVIPNGDIDFTVYLRIVDYNGVTKTEDEMVYDSNGYFHWDSIFTIDDLKNVFPKGIYIVQGWIEFSEGSYYEGGNDVIQFHIDPPGETGSNSWPFLEIFSYGGLITVSIALAFLFLREHRRRIGLKSH